MQKERAQLTLQSRLQLLNKSVLVYMEEMKRLFQRVDPNMTEEKKAEFLMRGTKQTLFAGFVRNPPKTVTEFARKASKSKWPSTSELGSTTLSYRPVNPETMTTVNYRTEVICRVVRGDLCHLLLPFSQPQAASFLNVVHGEFQHALDSPSVTTGAETEAINYAASVHNPRPGKTHQVLFVVNQQRWTAVL